MAALASSYPGWALLTCWENLSEHPPPPSCPRTPPAHRLETIRLRRVMGANASCISSDACQPVPAARNL